MIYAFIFVAKLVEVVLATIRTVQTARGNRVVASLLAAVEITIWIIVTSTVLLGLTEDPLRAVAFGLAYALGIFSGITLEDKLALGLAQIEIITGCETAKQLSKRFREYGFGVTTYDSEGMGGRKITIVLKVQRKDVQSVTSVLKEFNEIFVTITDIRKLSIGKIGRHVIK